DLPSWGHRLARSLAPCQARAGHSYLDLSNRSCGLPLRQLLAVVVLPIISVRAPGNPAHRPSPHRFAGTHTSRSPVGTGNAWDTLRTPSRLPVHTRRAPPTGSRSSSPYVHRAPPGRRPTLADTQPSRETLPAGASGSR